MKRTSVKMILLLLLFSAFLNITSLFAEEFSGEVIYDYYNVEMNNNDLIEGMNGFRFRRIYFTYDDKIEDKISVRFRLEMSDPGDFVTKDYYVPVVKDSYIKFKTAGSHEFILGIMGVPTFEMVEKVWGWREIERTPLDLHKYASSRDFGIAFKKPYSKDCRINYTFMLGNWTGNKSEENKGKKAYLLLGLKPVEVLYLELYGDIEYTEVNKYKHTNQGFIGMMYPKVKAGLLYAIHTQVDDGEEEEFEIGSVFFSSSLSSKLNLAMRYDVNFQPNPKGDEISYFPYLTTSPANLAILGISYELNDKIKIIPHVEYYTYGSEEGIEEIPDSELYYTLTVTYSW
ncbi:MAG: hypothetical protein PHV06_03695 [bacterium]|nr:hypothetical protein [bacterium]